MEEPEEPEEPEQRDELDALLARIPRGWSQTSYDGRRWGVTRTVHGDGRSQSVLAEELGGTGMVSTNAYLLDGRLVLKPCEMPAEVVLAFLRGHDPGVDEVEVGALAINVAVPEELRWTDVRRGEEFTLQTITVRLLPDGRLAAKAYGRPTAGGRGGYTSFPVPDRPEIAHLLEAAASRAGQLWAAHRGL